MLLNQTCKLIKVKGQDQLVNTFFRLFLHIYIFYKFLVNYIYSLFKKKLKYFFDNKLKAY